MPPVVMRRARASTAPCTTTRASPPAALARPVPGRRLANRTSTRTRASTAGSRARRSATATHGRTTGRRRHYHANKSEYATALLSNKTVEWLMRPGVGVGPRPWFAYFAPHGALASHSAHWYADACPYHGGAAPAQLDYTDLPRRHRLAAAVHADRRTADRRPGAAAASACSASTTAARRSTPLVTALGVAQKTCGLFRATMGTTWAATGCPSNKFLLYDHSLRIPMVIRGPGVPPASSCRTSGPTSTFAPRGWSSPAWTCRRTWTAARCCRLWCRTRARPACCRRRARRSRACAGRRARRRRRRRWRLRRPSGLPHRVVCAVLQPGAVDRRQRRRPVPDLRRERDDARARRLQQYVHRPHRRRPGDRAVEVRRVPERLLLGAGDGRATASTT